MKRVFYPIPGWHKPEELPHSTPAKPLLMTDGCPVPEPCWYYVALPTNHPECAAYPDNLMSYCHQTDAATAVSIYKELIANGEPVLGIVRVSAYGGAVELRNDDRNTNGLAHHHKDFGSW